MGGFGEKLKTARLRRRYSADMVAQRAGIARATLHRIELGDPGVSFGNYARVMQVLRLEQDLTRLATDDELGRKLQDAEIGTRGSAGGGAATWEKPVQRNERPAEISAGPRRCRGDGWPGADGYTVRAELRPAGSVFLPVCAGMAGASESAFAFGSRSTVAGGGAVPGTVSQQFLGFSSTQLLIAGDAC